MFLWVAESLPFAGSPAVPIDISQFIEATAAATRRSELFALFQDYLEDNQIEVASYHQVRQQLSEADFGDSLKFFSFPESWVRHYEASDYYDIDPIIAASRQAAEPFHWFEVDEIVPLSDEQKQFLIDLKTAGLKDGLAVPVFGPNGDMAYFGLGTCKKELDLSESEIDELHLACHQFHLRFCEISEETDGTGENEPEKALSPREREILSWVAKGKSNYVIGEILGISEHTVDTNIRRTFKKLGVNSRITAAVKAVGIGLISV